MKLLPVLLISLLLCQHASADDMPTDEQQALLRIDQHLAELVTLIDKAEQAADPDARIKFRYDWLRRDVATVRKGVQSHVHRPLAEALANAQLHGDYRR